MFDFNDFNFLVFFDGLFQALAVVFILASIIPYLPVIFPSFLEKCSLYFSRPAPEVEALARKLIVSVSYPLATLAYMFMLISSWLIKSA